MILAIKTMSLDPSERVEPTGLLLVRRPHGVVKTGMCVCVCVCVRAQVSFSLRALSLMATFIKAVLILNPTLKIIHFSILRTTRTIRSKARCGAASCDFQQSGDDVGVCGVKGQTIHLHRQVTSFPASYPKTHQSGEDGLLLQDKESVFVCVCQRHS